MGRPKQAFVDVLYRWLEDPSTTEQEVRDAVTTIGNRARWKRWSFRVRVEPINALAPKTANGERASRSSTPEAKKKDADTPLLDAAEGAGK